MSQRTDLVASIANTIQDYRGGSLPQPIPDHVEHWVQQFDAAVQLPILQEIDHVLKKIYFSKEDVAKFLRGAMRTQKLTGDKPEKFWRSASFLDIQGGGSSQTDMLALFSEQLEDEHGFGIDDCGQGDEVFIYLDDGIFTGNRVRRDLENWIRDHAPAQAKVHVICIAQHSGGQYYASGKIQDAIRAAGKTIGITWWRAIELEDRRAYSTTADVLRPTAIPTRESLANIIESYAQVVEEEEADASGKKRKKRKQIFPRFHQLRTVRALLRRAHAEGVGKRYLIQHSAGSGKSNTIAWLAHQLVELRRADDPMTAQFDSIIVITDRRALDTQIARTIKGYDHVAAIFGHSDNAQELREYGY